MPREETYLGDGLYASFDGYAITLRAPREGSDHYVVLEPDVYESLVEYGKEQRRKLEGTVKGE